MGTADYNVFQLEETISFDGKSDMLSLSSSVILSILNGH